MSSWEGFFRGLGTFFFGTILMAIFDLLWAFPIMWAWNYVMPYLFDLPELNWLKSFCLLFILCSLWKITIFGYEK